MLTPATKKHRLSPIFSAFRDREDEAGPGHSKRQIISGVVSAVGGRGVAVLANFFLVPLTVRYLGAERYGVWVTLTSVLGYLIIFDLGIGSTAINGVADALAKGDYGSARERVNLAYLTLAGIAILAGIGISLAWPVISWPAVLGDTSAATRKEITAAAAVAFAVVLINFPLSITPRIFGAWTIGNSIRKLLHLGPGPDSNVRSNNDCRVWKPAARMKKSIITASQDRT